MPARIESLALECIRMCRTIAEFTETPGAIARTFLSPPMRDCHAYLQHRMNSLGMRTHIDAAGNLRGLYPGATSDAARVVIGSHLDTVPNAGAFDGILGVVLGIALVEALNGEQLPIEIEIVGFSEEEGVRFRTPFIGSRGFVGTLDDVLLSREDSAGVSVAAAIDEFGLDRSRMREAVFNQRSAAFLEFHIEQGPVLESMGQPLAVVNAISGQSRATVIFEGEANHAGTTPMKFRRDALSACAEWIVAVEAYANRVPGMVATVGTLEVVAGAGNIVPGKVIASLDVRHAADEMRRAALDNLRQSAIEIAERRGIRFSHSVQLEQNTVHMDSRLVALAEESLHACRVRSPGMTSGAGHDAMIIAPRIPSVMIFLRSPKGLSHHPEETVLPGDVALALECGRHFLRALGSTLPYK